MELSQYIATVKMHNSHFSSHAATGIHQPVAYTPPAVPGVHGVRHTSYLEHGSFPTHRILLAVSHAVEPERPRPPSPQSLQQHPGGHLRGGRQLVGRRRHHGDHGHRSGLRTHHRERRRHRDKVGDLNDRFLLVGHPRRENQPTKTAKGRHVMGRKGIGKLSLFAIAKTIQVETAKDGTMSGLVMRADDIRAQMQEKEGDYHPDPLPASEISVAAGTRSPCRICVSTPRRDGHGAATAPRPAPQHHRSGARLRGDRQ